MCLFHFCWSRQDTWLVLLSSTTFDLGNCLSLAFLKGMVWTAFKIHQVIRCNISNIVQHCLAAKQVPVETNRMNSRTSRLDLRHRQRSENALQVGDPDPCGILGGFGRCQNGSAMPNYLDIHVTYTTLIHYHQIKSKSKHDIEWVPSILDSEAWRAGSWA